MSTNVLLLPAFSNQSSFTVANNADWKDGIMFAAPGSVGAPITVTAALTQASATVIASTLALTPGMPIAIAPGIPGGAFVGSVFDAQTFQMVDSAGNPLNATLTDDNVALTINPVPLDITGIEFRAQVRALAGGNDVYLTADTADGTFVNGGTNGILLFQIPASSMNRVRAGSYVMDIVAEGDGNTINLFPVGPAAVNVVQGITND
jgi:hypothetical protein